MLAMHDTLAVDVADAQALKAKAASGDKEALRGAARQFESLMVAQMLKTMRATRFNDEDDPMTGGDGLKLYQELLDQQWASRMSSGKGLGFAEMMVKAMERSAGVQPSGASAATPATAGVMPPRAASPAAPVVQPGAQPGAQAGIAAGTASVDPAQASTPPVAGSQTIGFQAAGGSARERKQQFLEAMRPHAEAAAAATGVPARFILAHAALESGWGAREIRTQDGQSSHNLFGIKAGAGWRGNSVATLTTEYRQGMPMKQDQSFRAYDDYGAAFMDYAQLLKTRYGSAVGAGQDASGFAQGLASGGYATDPAYANKLQSVIASVAMAGV